MISLQDTIKIGHTVEYVFDMIGYTPFGMRDMHKDNCMIVSTDYGCIIVTDDTRIMRSDGTYIRASQIKPYTHSLKHVAGVAVVKDVYYTDPQVMAEISDTDYVIVNGFYIAPDM